MERQVATATRQHIRFDRAAQIKAAVIVVAFFAAFWKLLAFAPFDSLGELVYKWVYQSDWSHGPIIPLFSAYLVYSKWDQLRRCAITYAWVGLPILLAGVLGYLYVMFVLPFGYAKPLSMMIALLGLIVLLCGVPALRYLWVPWLYLFFAIPLPKRTYLQLTQPLREWAATIATAILGLADSSLQIERSGSVIDTVYRGVRHQIGVADACSGMRSTITLCALGVAVAFMSDRPVWQRIALVLSCLPIAVFCNFLRVLITTYLFVYVDERYATGNFHTLLGLLMLGVAFGLFTGLGWLLSRLVVEEPEAPENANAA